MCSARPTSTILPKPDLLIEGARRELQIALYASYERREMLKEMRTSRAELVTATEVLSRTWQAIHQLRAVAAC